MIGGTVSRLLAIEVQALMHIEKEIKMDPVDSVTQRHFGNAAPVGMMRAMGLVIEAMLRKYSEGKGAVLHSGTAREWQEQKLEATQKAQPVGVLIKKYTTNHVAKMVAWQAASAARAAVVMAETAKACPRWWEISESARDKLRQGARFLSRQRWLKLQRQKGDREVTRLEEKGVDDATVLLARATVRQALKLE